MGDIGGACGDGRERPPSIYGRLSVRRLGRSRIVRAGGLCVGAVGASALLAGCMSWNTEPASLGTLGGSRSFAKGINDAGWVVGVSDTVTSGVQHAFVFHDGAMTDLDGLSSSSSQAEAINSRGWIVGQSKSSPQAPPDGRATLWQGKSATDLGTLGGKSSNAVAINSQGWIVGTSDTSSKTVDGFVWHDGTMTDLNVLTGSSFLPTGINDAGIIVGTHQTSTGLSPAVLRGTTVTDLPTPPADADNLPTHYGEADAINSQGDVAGYVSQNGGYNWHVIIWKHDGTTVEVADSKARNGILVGAINNADQVAWSTNGPPGGGVVWSEGSNHNLNPPCVPPACSNYDGRGAAAYGINNHGVIVGWVSPSGVNVVLTPPVAALWAPGGSLS